MLDNPAVDAEGRQVAGLIEEPDAFPVVEEQAQVFGREDELLCGRAGSAE